MKNTFVKSAFSQLDEDLAATLMEALQFALNDSDVIENLTEELELTETQLEVLAGLAIDISNSNGGELSIKTMADFGAATAEMNNLKSDVMAAEAKG